MARGKSGSSGGDKRGRGRPSKKEKEVKNEDVVEVDNEEASDNEEQPQEEEDTGELPAVPNSVQASKKILVVPTVVRSSGWENVQEIYIKHPRTNVKSLFLLCKKKDDNDFHIFEVLTMQQDTRSWFVNNRVISDGNLYLSTPIDPLFLVLPVLSKSSKTMPIADHFSENPLLPSLLVDTLGKCLSHKQLENITVKKGCDDIVAFAYSEEKTLEWLSKKAEKVSEYFCKKGISQAESSVSSNFVKTSSETISEDDCLRYACEVVGEYLDDSLKRKLFEKYGLPVVQEKSGVKRKGEEESTEGSNKKTKMTDGENVPLEDYGSKSNTPVNNATKVTARDKQLQKAAQGSHSLLKFFAAKTK